MNKGDSVLLVRTSRPVIAVGEVTGDYRFEHTAADPFYHWRSVNWLAQQVPRWHFGDDLLLAFSAGLAICPLRRPNADGRIAALRKQGWQPESLKMDDSYDAFSGGIDLEAFARDRMTRQVALCCKKYGAASLVTAVLKRQGGAVAAISDGPESAQLLAAAGPLGFDAPRIFVRADFTQSAAGPQDVQDVLALAEKHQAERALYIAWAGFAPAAMEKAAENFFRLRLWSQDEFIRELCASGAGLGLEPAEFLRLRNIWITAAQ
jgi:restriction system protein